MGMMDKFLNTLHLGADDDDAEYYDEEFYDEEEDEYEAPRKKVFRRETRQEEPEAEPSYLIQQKEPKAPAKQASKVTPMRPVKKSQGGNKQMEVCVIKPTSVEDSREITETLLANRTVVLNLEGIDMDIAQRIIDFTSGACFAIGGNLQKVSTYIFLATPATVEITGDIQNFVNSFDVSSLNSKL